MPEEMVSRILRLPGYGVYAWEAEELTGTLRLWIRQTAPEPYYVCGGCGISVREVHSWTERQVRDLPWGAWHVWLMVEVHRVRCRRCGVRTERLPFVAGKAHYTTRLETAVAQDCEAAPVSRVAAKWGLPPETVRRMDKRVLRRWAASRPRQPLRSLGVDEISLGKRDKFLTVVSDLERGEPLWVGLERKRETLDRFFAEALPAPRRRAVRAVCVDMWSPSCRACGSTCPTPGSSTTSFTSCAMPTMPWTRPAAPSSFARAATPGACSRGNGGYCCAGGPTWNAMSAGW